MTIDQELYFTKGLKMACKLWVDGRMTETLLECLERRIARLVALQGIKNGDHDHRDMGCAGCEVVEKMYEKVRFL